MIDPLAVLVVSVLASLPVALFVGWLLYGSPLEDDESGAEETVPCWKCGADRYTFEACQECGALGSEYVIEEARDEILRDQLAETIEDMGLSEQAAEAIEAKALGDEGDGGQP